MGIIRDLLDIYAQTLRATGPRAESIHIRLYYNYYIIIHIMEIHNYYYYYNLYQLTEQLCISIKFKSKFSEPSDDGPV